MQITINRLTILSSHPILDQVAADIAKGIEVEALPDKDIVVYQRAQKVQRFEKDNRLQNLCADRAFSGCKRPSSLEKAKMVQDAYQPSDL